MAPRTSPPPSGLHVSERGRRDAAPILFLHGFLGSGADWGEVVAHLEGRRGLLVDLPGHGGSTGRAEEVYTFGGVAAAIAEVIDGLGAGACDLAGYSMGGRVALHFAAAHPERVRSLALVSASPGLSEERERAARRRTDEALARRLEAEPLEAFLAEWYRQALFEPLVRHAGGPDEVVRRRLRNEPGELARALRGLGAGVQPPLWSALSALACPVLYVAGGDDVRYVHVGRRAAGAGSGIRLEVIPGAGHALPLERPDALGRLLRDFFGAGAAVRVPGEPVREA